MFDLQHPAPLPSYKDRSLDGPSELMDHVFEEIIRQIEEKILLLKELLTELFHTA